MIFASTVLRRFMDTKLWFKFLWFLTWLHHPLFRFLCGQAAYNTIWDQFNTPAIIIQIKSRKLKFTKPTTARNVITPSTFLLHTQTSQSVSSLSQSVFLITFLDSDWFPCHGTHLSRVRPLMNFSRHIAPYRIDFEIRRTSKQWSIFLKHFCLYHACAFFVMLTCRLFMFTSWNQRELLIL